MSFALMVTFEDGRPEPHFDSQLLAYSIDRIESLAARHNLTPLSTYMDNRDVPEDFDGTPEDLLETMGPFDLWFDPRQAASKLAELAKATATATIEYNTDIAREIAAIANILQANPARRFHFDMAI